MHVCEYVKRKITNVIMMAPKFFNVAGTQHQRGLQDQTGIRRLKYLLCSSHLFAKLSVDQVKFGVMVGHAGVMNHTAILFQLPVIQER